MFCRKARLSLQQLASSVDVHQAREERSTFLSYSFDERGFGLPINEVIAAPFRRYTHVDDGRPFRTPSPLVVTLHTER
jgi:hypothetical protein